MREYSRQTDNKKQILFAKKFYPTKILDFGTPIRKIVVCLSFEHYKKSAENSPAPVYRHVGNSADFILSFD